jgi:hypothetical protein
VLSLYDQDLSAEVSELERGVVNLGLCWTQTQPNGHTRSRSRREIIVAIIATLTIAYQYLTNMHDFFSTSGFGGGLRGHAGAVIVFNDRPLLSKEPSNHLRGGSVILGFTNRMKYCTRLSSFETSWSWTASTDNSLLRPSSTASSITPTSWKRFREYDTTTTLTMLAQCHFLPSEA